ncbi:MAG: poly-gamma-glutamate system protein [Candidatus Moduliflexus flocculans]|nr:poly-gamma-glutamate system protein [Candidatus Moduliflexus flocculans]
MKTARAALWILAALLSAAAPPGGEPDHSPRPSPHYPGDGPGGRDYDRSPGPGCGTPGSPGDSTSTPLRDPNRTGLIGLEYAETTTTLGDLEAKRTSASPDMAALAVLLLREAGLEPGDAIAVGASGSFPGLALAVLSAARALDLDVALVASLGALLLGRQRPGLLLPPDPRGGPARPGLRD